MSGSFPTKSVVLLPVDGSDGVVPQSEAMRVTIPSVSRTDAVSNLALSADGSIVRYANDGGPIVSSVIGTKSGIMGGGAATGITGDGTHMSATTRMSFDVPFGVDWYLTAVEYYNGRLPVAGETGGEQAGANAMTVKAAIELAGSGEIIPLFGSAGARTVTIPAGGRVRLAPATPILIPDGSIPFTRQYVTVATAGHTWPVGRVAMTSRGDCSNYIVTGGVGAGQAADVCDAVGAFGTTAGSYSFGPAGIYGYPADKRRRPALAIWGDSLSTYSGYDVSPNYGDERGYAGYIERALRNQLSFITVTRSGTSMAQIVPSMGNTLALTAPFVTDVLIALGRNDISNGLTLEQVQANFAAIASAYQSYGARVWATTITPRPTATTNSWVDGGSAISAPQEAVRIPYNAWLRNLPLSITGCFDVTRKVEDPARPGYWIPSVSAYSTDGTHMTLVGMNAAGTAIDVARIGNMVLAA